MPSRAHLVVTPNRLNAVSNCDHLEMPEASSQWIDVMEKPMVSGFPVMIFPTKPINQSIDLRFPNRPTAPGGGALELPGRGSDLALGRFFDFYSFHSILILILIIILILILILILVYIFFSFFICFSLYPFFPLSLSLSGGIRRQTIKHISTTSRIYVSPSSNPI